MWKKDIPFRVRFSTALSMFSHFLSKQKRTSTTSISLHWRKIRKCRRTQATRKEKNIFTAANVAVTVYSIRGWSNVATIINYLTSKQNLFCWRILNKFVHRNEFAANTFCCCSETICYYKIICTFSKLFSANFCKKFCLQILSKVDMV